MSGQHEVIGFLSRADSYGCPGGTVERIETHGSLIFLCGERVYKLKREIAYASLDFLTLEKRERACHAELMRAALPRRYAIGEHLPVRRAAYPVRRHRVQRRDCLYRCSA